MNKKRENIIGSLISKGNTFTKSIDSFECDLQITQISIKATPFTPVYFENIHGS